MSSRKSNNNRSRRQFLGQASAAAGAAAFMGAYASGANANEFTYKAMPIAKAKPRRRLGKDDPIRIGVVGPGGMGTGHCDAYGRFVRDGKENIEVVALCDVCDPRAQNAANMLKSKYDMNVDKIYRHHEDLMARDDIDAVLVATTEHWHGKIAEDALLSGKDVYCEKPMTLRLDQALRLYDVVKANPQQIFQVGTQMIMLPKYIEAQKLIADGYIGKPTSSQTSYCRNNKDGEWLYYGIDPKWEPGVNMDWKRWCGDIGQIPWNPEIYARWRRYKNYSTGIIGDLLVHVITPMIMALDMGWPTRVTASGGHYVDKVMENHDQVNLTVEFEKEHTMVIAGSTSNSVGLETLIRGHKANIYLNSRHCVVRPERHWVDEIDEQTIQCPDIGNDQDQLRLNWMKSIRSREPAISNVDLATKVMVIVDLATRSMWNGHAYSYDSHTRTAAKI